MLKVFYTRLDLDASLSPKEHRQSVSKAGYNLMLRSAERCGFDISDVEIVKSSEGKPYVKNDAFYFSISHTDNFVCVAICDSEVGIDAQKIGDVNEKIVQRFLKAEPSTDIENTYLWTDFEAIGKYFGTGIPHAHTLSSDLEISRFQCLNYCISVCHGVEKLCTLPEKI